MATNDIAFGKPTLDSPLAFQESVISGYLLTEVDFHSRIRPEIKNLIDRDKEGFLIKAVKAAEKEAKAYLHQFNITSLFSAVGDDRDDTLVIYLMDITIWHFISISNANISTEFTLLRYEKAISWLKMIQSGKIIPFGWLPAVTPANANVRISGSDITRRETRY